MSATQQERRAGASSQRAIARGDGYRDGLYGVLSRRLGQPPDLRFDYDAGHRDGDKAREVLLQAQEARLQALQE